MVECTAFKEQAVHDIGHRIRRFRESLGYSKKDAPSLFGIPTSSYQKYEQGSSFPGSEAIEKLVVAGINANWLLTGKGEMFNALSGLAAPKMREDTPYPSGSATVLSAQEATASGRYIALPLHNNVRAAAGHGAIVGNEEADDSLMFREDWIYRDLRMQPKDLILIRVSGESMRPTLNNGDVILVNHSLTRPDKEGIYIMRMGDMLLVKRLQALPDGQIRVTSDNPVYEPWTLDTSKMAEGNVAIIGRVVWAGTRF
jgi:bacteriophage CI repressor helix-turn-helix domain|nr:MAG TPA: Repressor protein CI [Caudoviricetes sp.]